MNSSHDSSGAQSRWIHDGRRLHLQHGPIDIILTIEGEAVAKQEAYARAIDAFPAILPTLVTELHLLRTPIESASADTPTGRVARRMFMAASAFADERYVTPMAAVAGAVADELLMIIVSGKPLRRVSVNNGGDIALYLRTGECFDIGVCTNVQRGTIAASIKVSEADGIGGIATSGWAGRSHSFGIADAVTVLAHDAVHADCAATMIANATNLSNCSKIQRLPANELFPDSDLGDRLVTVGVDELSPAEVGRALEGGAELANQLLINGGIKSAFLVLQGQMLVIGHADGVTQAKFETTTTQISH